MVYELGKAYCCECVEGMKTIPDGFVDLTVTSPPYDNMRSYNGYTFDFENVARELYRVTKPGGVVVWVVADATVGGSETLTSFRQALFFRSVGFNVHDTMIYAKENWIPLTHKRYEQQFEYMFIFSKGSPSTFNPLKMPTSNPGAIKSNARRDKGESRSAVRPRPLKRVTPREKRKPNIWMYKVGNNCSTKDREAFIHPAIFPEQLATDHILSWSNPDDIIFDPMCGSGTTLKMAILNGRKVLGFDISQEYVDIANERISNHA